MRRILLQKCRWRKTDHGNSFSRRGDGFNLGEKQAKFHLLTVGALGRQMADIRTWLKKGKTIGGQ